MNEDTKQILKAIDALDWRLSHVLSQIAEKLSPDWVKVLDAQKSDVTWPVDEDSSVPQQEFEGGVPDWVQAIRDKEKHAGLE